MKNMKKNENKDESQKNVMKGVDAGWSMKKDEKYANHQNMS